MAVGMFPDNNAVSAAGDSQVHAGSTHVCKACGRPLDESSAKETKKRLDFLRRLSESQRQVLGYLLMGMTEPQIAEKLHRSRHTVHDHTKAIYAVCGVTRRVHLVQHFLGMDGADLVEGQIPSYLL
jgi:DNA-binding NarL/FixJ family response regulator